MLGDRLLGGLVAHRARLSALHEVALLLPAFPAP